MEIISLPIICTSHLSQEVASRLTDEGDKNPWVPCATWQHGFFICLKSIGKKVELGEDVPQCLRDIASWISNKGLPCSDGVAQWNSTWVQLDQGAGAVDGIPTYDW